VERRLAAILATDVVGYSRLIRADEEGTIAALKTLQADLFDPILTKHNGRIVKLMGDGMLVEFASVVDAVRTAVETQAAVAKHNVALPENKRIEFRIGVNLGDVVIDGEDIHGDGVNVASRLEGLAEPSGICVSDKVYEEVRDRTDLAFEDLGEQEVKNIDRPVRVYRILPDGEAGAKPPVPVASKKLTKTWPAAVAVALLVAIGGGGAWWWQLQESRVVPADPAKMAFELPEKPSIAVLPFVNISDDSEQEHFADGLTEDLITDLSKVSDLFVIARNSTFVYKGRSVPVRQVSEDLGVRYVLEGSVRRAGDTVRINAQLIDATTGGHLWAERYDGNATDIFRVQDGFVREIVGALALNLSEDEQKEMVSGQTSNIEAREAFQNGWEHYLRYTAEDNATAAEHFKRAAELDPEYGRAYSALGLVYVRGCQWRWNRNLGLSPSGAFNTAVDYLTKGEEHSSSMTKVAASQIYLYDGDNDKAFTEAARAVRQDPNDPEAQVAMGLAMITTGRPEAGLEFIETALRLSPSHPTHYVLARAVAYFTMNELEQSADILAAALERDPGAVDLAPILAASYAHLGRREEAHAALRLWKPEASQSELQTELSLYHFPYTFSVGREILDRLTAGLEIAALPSDVTVESLMVTLRQSEKVIERRSAARKLGIFGPAAKPAVPALQALLDDPTMKNTVERVLEKIIGK
jgi:TolB-like protein/class 3 adenylate cyclase/thioredoxin-like negative regulator of GroEL